MLWGHELLIFTLSLADLRGGTGTAAGTYSAVAFEFYYVHLVPLPDLLYRTQPCSMHECSSVLCQQKLAAETIRCKCANCRGYINFTSLYIVWLIGAVFYHLPSLESMGVNIKVSHQEAQPIPAQVTREQQETQVAPAYV
eukprot:1156745-Pelagomonas_calceolata.AAC.7